jgi:hypothetical protein
MTFPLDHFTVDRAVDAAIDRRRRRPTGVLTGEVADATASHPVHAVEDVAVRCRARPRARRLDRPRASDVSRRLQGVVVAEGRGPGATVVSRIGSEEGEGS